MIDRQYIANPGNRRGCQCWSRDGDAVVVLFVSVAVRVALLSASTVAQIAHDAEVLEVRLHVVKL